MEGKSEAVLSGAYATMFSFINRTEQSNEKILSCVRNCFSAIFESVRVVIGAKVGVGSGAGVATDAGVGVQVGAGEAAGAHGAAGVAAGVAAGHRAGDGVGADVNFGWILAFDRGFIPDSLFPTPNVVVQHLSVT